MKQLSPSARRLFELARGQDEPDAAARHRVAHSLAAKIASGVGLGAVGASASAATAGLAAIAVKSALVVGIASVVAGGGYWAVRSARPVAPSATLHHKAAPNVEPMARPHVDQEPAPASLPAETDQGRFSVHRKPGRPTPRVEAPPGPATAVPVTTDALRAETEALRSAQQSLRDGAPERALRLLDEQDRSFRAGLLQQERAAARVLALCQAGMVPEARAQAIRFERLWPRSALLGRVRAACAAPTSGR
jgi:hypothetical protein